MLNEAAQWAVLVFLTIFVLGLTRQLGNFLTVGRARTAEVQGPRLGQIVPSSLLRREERERLAALMDERGVDWSGMVVMDERCVGCDEMLHHLERDGTPRNAPLFLMSRSENVEYRARLAGIADVVAVDPDRLKRWDITATPLCMIVDSEFRLVQKAIGTHLDTLVQRWRDGSATSAASNGEAPNVLTVARRQAHDPHA